MLTAHTPAVMVGRAVIDGVQFVDYTPAGLLALFIVLIAVGRLAPWPVIKDKNTQIAKLESAVAKLLEAGAVKDKALLAEQNAHGETRRMLIEEQKTGAVIRRFLDGLDQAIPR